MQKKVQKRYIMLGIIIVLVGVLIWRVSTSYAYMNIGYEGNNIISGDKWGINIIEIDKPELTGDAIITKDISTIATTLNFDVSLFKPGDKVSFNVTVQNTSKLNAELYALTLSGLSNMDGEVINYTIRPIDSSVIHDDDSDGSIMKPGDKQVFNITVEYNKEASDNNHYEHNLNLGSTIIYKQK